MLELAPNDPIIKTYIKDLQHLKSQQSAAGLWSPNCPPIPGDAASFPMAPSATNTASPAAGGRRRTRPITWLPKSRKNAAPVTPPATLYSRTPGSRCSIRTAPRPANSISTSPSRSPPLWRKSEKLQFVAAGDVPWQTIKPDADHTWLVPGHAVEYKALPAIEEIFDLHTSGVKTNRDDVVYDWARNAGEPCQEFYLRLQCGSLWHEDR